MAIISRANADALIPQLEKLSPEIFKAVSEKSVALQLFRKLPNMTTKTASIPVLSALPIAYWVSGDTGLKATTNAEWVGKVLTAEEIAVIVPIPEAVLADASYDIWGELKPSIEEAFANKIDDAMINGVDKPASWPNDIVKAAELGGYSFAKTSDFLADGNKALDLVESAGYEVSGLIGGPGFNSAFRNMLDGEDRPIVGTELQGLPRYKIKNGAFDTTNIYFIAGDFKQAVYSIRQDMAFKILDQGVINDGDGKVLLNFAQNDSIGLRCVMRIAYQLPNPVNRIKPSEAGRLPFAVCRVTANKLVVVLSPASAITFTTSQVVSMSCSVNGAKIYYTDNGDTPDATKTLYTAPITLTATKTIKAIAIRSDYTSSDVVSVTYTKAT